MARPRKGSEQKDALRRLSEAFWTLLEDNDVSKITVGMLCSAAGCNRGTFYYHFADKDEFISYVVNNDLIGDVYLQAIINMITETGSVSISSIITDERIEKFAALMQNGGKTLETYVKSYALEMWTTVLCTNGMQLKDETRAIIEFMASAQVGMLTYIGVEGMKGNVVTPPTVFLSAVAHAAMEGICDAQGITREELASRLEMAGKVTRLVSRS
jgi:AcrR family transcriptional regulator